MLHDVLITDLTRMRDGKVCLAGVTSQLEVVRPELPAPGILDEVLFQDGKAILFPRAVVQLDLKPLDPDKPPSLPHVEDRPWMRGDRIAFLRVATEERWYAMLEKLSWHRLAEAFETNILDKKMLEPGTGARSLVTIQHTRAIKFMYTADTYKPGQFQYRLVFKDDRGEGAWTNPLPVTDLALRLYCDHLRAVEKQTPEAISERLTKQFVKRETFIRVGVTRPFQKSRNDPAYCYLQVNGLYTFPDYLDGRNFAHFAASDQGADC